jgi:hypothetical protein
MDQSHIGYTTWRDPPENTMAAIKLTTVTASPEPSTGITPEQSVARPPGASEPDMLFDAFNRQRYGVDVFNRGSGSLTVTVKTSDPWIVSSVQSATVAKDLRVDVTIDWDKAPKGTARGSVEVSTGSLTGVMDVIVRNPADLTRDTVNGFVEGAGYVSIEPEHFTKNNAAGSRSWIRIEDYGRTLSGMRAEAPVDAPAATPGTDAPSLEYRMYLFTPGKATVTSILAPTLNFVPGRGLRMAVSLDDETPTMVDVVPAVYNAAGRDWEESVKNNARTVTTTHEVAAAGYHTLKIWMVDPAVVVQKLVVTTGGATLPKTYLGPPESYRGK